MSSSKSLDQLLKVGKPIVVPAPPPFVGVDSDAHNWNVNLTSKYVTEVLELPQIAEQIKRGDMNGHALICMDEEHLNNLKVDNLLQKLKVVSHAQMLKNKVFEKAAIQKPANFADWTSVHVAAWLTYKHSSSKAAMNLLRAKVDGKLLMDMKEDKLHKLLTSEGTSSKEANQALTAIQQMQQEVAQKAAVNPPAVPTAAEEEDGEDGEDLKKGSSKKKKKSSTKMSKRRAAEAAEAAMNDSEDSDRENVKVNTTTGNTTRPTSSSSGSQVKGISSHMLPVVQEEGSREVNEEVSPVKPNKNNSKSSNTTAASTAIAAATSTSESIKKPSTSSSNNNNISDVLIDSANADEEANDENMTSMKQSRKGKKLKTKKQIEAAAHLEAQKTIETNIADFTAGRVTSSLGSGVSLQDSYTSSNERREFLEKIAGLRRTVEEHTATMNQMHEYATRLKIENEQQQREQRQLLLENSTNKNVIHNLVKDRNTAVNELQQVVQLYESAALHEKQLLARDIAAMTEGRQQLKNDNNDLSLTNRLNKISLQQAGGAGAATGSSYQYAPLTLGNMAGQLTTAATNNNTAGGDHDGDSDLEDDSASPKKKGAAVKTGSTTATTAPGGVGVPIVTTANPAKGITSNSGASIQVPTAVATSTSVVGAAVSVPTALPGSSVPTAAAASTVEKPLMKEVNFMSMVDATAHTETALWQGIIATYSYTNKSSSGIARGSAAAPTAASASDVISSAVSIEDTHTLLTKIAILWTRLGLRMLTDAHSSSTEPGVAKALRGLEKCARRSLLEFREINPDSSSGDNRTASVGVGNHSPSRSKKFQLTSTSNSLTATTSSMAAADKLDHKVHHSEVCLCCCPLYSKQQLQQPQHCVAVGMVFAMGLAQRILEKYPKEEDQTNLLSLLNLLKFGDLPVSELSRENLRDLLIYNLGIDLPWDRFNSVCQRVDPEKKGFISSVGMLRGFQLLTPLLSGSVTSANNAATATSLSNSVDKKQLQTLQQFPLTSHKDVLFVNLLTLTSCVASLTADKRDITETFIDIISGNGNKGTGNKNVPASFSKFMAKEQSKYSGSGALSGSRVSLLSSGSGEDIRILDDQSLVSDILRETSRELVWSLIETKGRDWRNLSDGYRKQRLCEEHPHHLSHHRSSYQVPVEYFAENHREVTHQTAKNYQIYDDQQQSTGILSNLSRMVVSFLVFRRTCIKVMLATSNATGGTISRHGVSEGDLNDLVLDCESSLLALLGDRLQTQSLLDRSDDTTLADTEGQMCELLGIPVPCCCCCYTSSSTSSTGKSSSVAGSRCAAGSCGLIAAQCRVEAALFHTQTYLRYENSVLFNSEEVQPKTKAVLLASSQALKEIQRDVHSSLWGDDVTASGGVIYGGSDKIRGIKSLRTTTEGVNPNDFDDESTVSGSHKPVLLVSDLQVVAEANTLMHQQRVEQTTRYLEYLNGKAARKKKILLALVNLWKSTKIALGHRNAVTSLGVSQEMQEQMRLYALPVDDILLQTQHVQKTLINDMQRENDTKTSQLMGRINLLRAGILNNSICDEDQSLVEALREIATLENGLLQANADAMKLANKILSHLNSSGVH